MSSGTRTAASLPSSAWARAAIAAGAAALLGLLLYLLVAGFGGDGENPRRTAVARYIARVNLVQVDLSGELARLDQAYTRFAARKNPASIAELTRSEETVHDVRAGVRALEPPADAQVLHARLLRLLDVQAALAHELTLLGRYLPARAAEERQLAEATTALGRGLAETSATAGQRRVLDEYAARLDGAAERFAGVPAPASLVPSRRRVVARLHVLAGLARGLRSALEQRRRDQAATLLGRLVREAARPAGAAGESEALAAYERRRHLVDTRRRSVEREVLRLARELR